MSGYRKVNQWNAFKLNEYKGTYEIVSGNENEDTFYPTWMIASQYNSEEGHSEPVTKENGSYMNLPVKVVLGNKEEAIENLKWLLSQLEGGGNDGNSNSGSDNSSPGDDVPF